MTYKIAFPFAALPIEAQFAIFSLVDKKDRRVLAYTNKLWNDYYRTLLQWEKEEQVHSCITFLRDRVFPINPLNETRRIDEIARQLGNLSPYPTMPKNLTPVAICSFESTVHQCLVPALTNLGTKNLLTFEKEYIRYPQERSSVPPSLSSLFQAATLEHQLNGTLIRQTLQNSRWEDAFNKEDMVLQLIRLKHWNRAAEVAKTVSQFHPSTSSKLALLCICLAEKKNFDQAIETAERIPEQNAQNRALNSIFKRLVLENLNDAILKATQLTSTHSAFIAFFPIFQVLKDRGNFEKIAETARLIFSQADPDSSLHLISKKFIEHHILTDALICAELVSSIDTQSALLKEISLAWLRGNSFKEAKTTASKISLMDVKRPLLKKIEKREKEHLKTSNPRNPKLR